MLLYSLTTATCTHMYTHAHTHTHVYTRTHGCIFAQTHAQTHAHACHVHHNITRYALPSPLEHRFLISPEGTAQVLHQQSAHLDQISAG